MKTERYHILISVEEQNKIMKGQCTIKNAFSRKTRKYYVTNTLRTSNFKKRVKGTQSPKIVGKQDIPHELVTIGPTSELSGKQLQFGSVTRTSMFLFMDMIIMFSGNLSYETLQNKILLSMKYMCRNTLGKN